MEDKIVENKKEDLPSLDLFHSLISIASLIYRSLYLVCLRSTTPLWFTDRFIIRKSSWNHKFWASEQRNGPCSFLPSLRSTLTSQPKPLLLLFIMFLWHLPALFQRCFNYVVTDRWLHWRVLCSTRRSVTMFVCVPIFITKMYLYLWYTHRAPIFITDSPKVEGEKKLKHNSR